jgi:hypothetical protein
MERFKLMDLGSKKVMLAFDGSGWRVIESLEVWTTGHCPACGLDTFSFPGAYYTVPRPKNKGKDAVVLCTHAAAEVEEARKCLEARI